ncbi:hypothetical protein P153DRAFT_378428 [Dothidotthia symphoricarpi CBS 119687]|uniref:Uncharacterized protein n=1 Tax=Dothidotthia symphoricarpi CBS 119687 TaxID=1392245 RepID=A0A6A6A5P2_9PLEO|nr:uncharacterized protein P153DRAFT_378428 [Dothidotthia symphoricarpi CBS 119687]KAF2126227.1 hypothetical protein P153DRAFT_378428 [Dothidotthia symphoricarpi CBS 119687]
MASICRARLLSDLSGKTACDKEATSSDGRLCAFHSRQCQALYRGYKKRNAELDSLSEAPPLYLSSKKTSVVTYDFTDISEETTLRQIHDYLFRKYNLLDRVIRARSLHHSHFFAIDNDYGHAKYLDRLQNERHVMVKALEKLGKRAAAVMYEQKQWFDWVKKCQEEEEKQGENESKKVKLESLLLKRHQKEIDRHQKEVRRKEDRKREEQFLDETYKQRLSEEEEQEEWDPIQDINGYERDNYIDLIKFFLMLEDEAEETEPAQLDGAADTKPAGKALSKSAKKRQKAKNAELKKMAEPASQTGEGRGANVIEMETKVQMRERLRQPVKFERAKGWYVEGGGPVGLDASTPILPEEEIEALLDEVAEIKNFIFCRLLLSQATLLPVALEAASIDEFLAHDQVTREHLRDLCLKLERPGLQDVRDACADFIRERDGVEEEESEEPTEETDEQGEGGIPEKYRLVSRNGDRMPEKYQTKREKAAKKAKKQPPGMFNSETDGVLDFGKVTDEKKYSRKRMRIKICGRYMYNYPSEKALNRGGWFHFSVIAKDSDLFDAVELCRNWNEFFELNILCMYHYFPAPKWTRFIGDLPRQQLLQLGFIPYFSGDKAENVTNYFQTGSRGMARRAHSIVEMRNFICGHIKRDDPVSRRFIQYLALETFELRALVRDRKTGRILITPPEDELWILRQKSGWGRAARNEFDILGEIGPTFFEQMDKSRKWHFGFAEVYDVYVWDSSPGRSFLILQRKLEEILTRAMRVHKLKDMFSQARPILATITKDPNTERCRSIKPDEQVTSMWDDLDKTAVIWEWSTQHGAKETEFEPRYTEADELEDALLFPLEATGEMADNLFRNNPSAMEIFEKQSIDVRTFAADLDTDDEFSGSEGDFDSDMDDEAFEDDGELDGLEDDDNDEDWDTEEGSSDGEYGYVHKGEVGAANEAIDVLTKMFKGSSFREPDYFLSIIRNPSKANQIPESIRNNPADFMASLRIALRSQKAYDSSHIGIEADFHRHLDRQKSKIFKHSWHMADQEPDAFAHYYGQMFLFNAMEDYVMTSGVDPGPFELCKFMRMKDLFLEERRIVDDAFKAYASIAAFFKTEAFLASEDGKPFRESKLLNQAERAKQVPDRRTHMSNKTMPTSFWRDWDKLLKDNGRRTRDTVEDIFPTEWRNAIRPIIIRLFRAGIICQSYAGAAAGIAVAKAEPGRPTDLYIDYRAGIPVSKIVSHLADPTTLDRDFIVEKARLFQSLERNATFSVLRLWSAPHFYPLMLGIDKRPMCAFLDDRGRCWEFKFIPKDMPYSEWSIHQQLSLRLEPYRRIFGYQVVVAKDLVLIMGRNENNTRQLSEAVTWAIQTKPWRLEVDFWRSFVNVDVEFLEELDPRWLE